MRYKGEVLKGPSTDVVIYPYRDKEIVFELKAVLEFSEFLAICPEPTPTVYLKPGGERGQDFEDAGFKARRADWFLNRQNWLFLKSFERITIDGEKVDWEEIDPTVPATWGLWRSELSEFLTSAQITNLFNTIIELNSFDEKRMEEAKKRFLASRSQVAVQP